VKFRRVAFLDMQMNRHTDTQRYTDKLIAILHTHPGGEVIIP